MAAQTPKNMEKKGDKEKGMPSITFGPGLCKDMGFLNWPVFDYT